MTKIKICGIRSEQHAVEAARAGADFIGMVFADSPRQITADKAELISRSVKQDNPAVQVAGVFVNQPFEQVNEIADRCGLDWIQLSGNESAEYCSHIRKPVIKAIRIPAVETPGRNSYLENIEHAADLIKTGNFIFILDTFHRGKHGGTGKVFDWDLAVPFCKKYRAIVAGGLTPGNVGGLIISVNPWGVDVSSGVENNGVKDMKKIKAFINAVRRADEINSKTIA